MVIKIEYQILVKGKYMRVIFGLIDMFTFFIERPTLKDIRKEIM